MTSAVTSKVIEAVQQIKRMRGGSQAHLMRASDGNFYATKFQNNGQHVRVLANEFFASRIGSYLGLAMPEVAVIEVCDWIIEHTPELRMTVAGHETLCSSGLQLASRYVDDPENTIVSDYLPEHLILEKTCNWKDLAACVVFDKWTGNTDGRQAIFAKPLNARKFRMTLVDQGHCFNCGQWDFPDLPLYGVYFRNSVYDHVTGWESFEPILSRAEQMDRDDLWKLAQGMPDEWWSRDSVPETMPKEWWDKKFPSDLSRLIDTLYQRRSKIRDLITGFRNSMGRQLAGPSPRTRRRAPQPGALVFVCPVPKKIFERRSSPSQTFPALFKSEPQNLSKRELVVTGRYPGSTLLAQFVKISTQADQAAQ